MLFFFVITLSSHASQAMITPNYQSVIALFTRGSQSQFMWLLPPIGSEATYAIFVITLSS